MKRILIISLLFFLTVHFRHATVVWDYLNRIGIGVEEGTRVNLTGFNHGLCRVEWDNHAAWTDCRNLEKWDSSKKGD